MCEVLLRAVADGLFYSFQLTVNNLLHSRHYDTSL